MLRPGEILHVYGIEATVAIEAVTGSPDFAGLIHDDDWRYLVFTTPAAERLRAAGIAPGYEATLPYEQWLDGDAREPFELAGLVVVPPWCDPPPALSAGQLLYLEPGLAFGTGAHPTTQRCATLVRELIGHLGWGVDVLDLGCGTGVIGLAALRHGAGRVVGCDISAHAIDLARRNADRNQLADRCELVIAPAAAVISPAQLVVANLPPAAMTELLDHRSLTSASFIIASGMLAATFDQLRLGLPVTIDVVEVAVDGFWHTALLRRRPG